MRKKKMLKSKKEDAAFQNRIMGLTNHKKFKKGSNIKENYKNITLWLRPNFCLFFS